MQKTTTYLVLRIIISYDKIIRGPFEKSLYLRYTRLANDVFKVCEY